MPLDAETKTVVDAQLRSVFRVCGAGLVAGVGGALALATLLAEGGGLTSPAPPVLILYPVFVLFFLIAAVLCRMGWLRVTTILDGGIDVRFYRTYDEGTEPERLRVVTRHFINLFEMPVIFYVAVLMAHAAGEVSCLLVGLAWSYVLLRLAHSWVHLGTNDVPIRLATYAASGLVLLVFWSVLLAQMLSGGGAA